MEKLFKKYNIEINSKILNNFEIYFNELSQWNEKYNLTAITKKDEVYVKHFLDSAYSHKYIPKNSTVVDIGAGAGFPSLPLKIVRPDLKISMIDSLNKRVYFLEHIIAALELEEIWAYHSRAEDFAKEHRQEFDVCVARAVANLSTLCELSLPLIKIGGVLIAYKGAQVDDEIAAAQNAINVLGGKLIEVKKYSIENNGRSLIFIKKISQTPNKYPRGKNLPKTKPL